MIGGHDIRYNLRPQPMDMDLILRLVLNVWPEARFQDVDSEESVPVAEHLKSFRRPPSSEFFLYRDLKAFQSWQSEGLCDDNNQAMLHAILAEDGITLIVDDPGTPLEALAHRIGSNLRTARFGAPVSELFESKAA